MIIIIIIIIIKHAEFQQYEEKIENIVSECSITAKEKYMKIMMACALKYILIYARKHWQN
jgi:hypothetical protein